MLFFGFVLQMSSLMDQPMTPFGRRNKDLFPKLSLLVPAAVVSIIQLMSLPRPAGSGSVRMTPVAVALPSLKTATVKPACVPAMMVA